MGHEEALQVEPCGGLRWPVDTRRRVLHGWVELRSPLWVSLGDDGQEGQRCGIGGVDR